MRSDSLTRLSIDTVATLYAVGLFASALGTWVNHRREPDYQTLGASGAILAVLFASTCVSMRQRGHPQKGERRRRK
jgi:membrane associated rhomboid family serine protease